MNSGGEQGVRPWVWVVVVVVAGILYLLFSGSGEHSPSGQGYSGRLAPSVIPASTAAPAAYEPRRHETNHGVNRHIAGLLQDSSAAC
jgi:hypothetical protein